MLLVIYCLVNIYEGILIWWPISHTRANVLLCPFNFTVLLFSPINIDIVCKKNVTKARTLLFTAVHGPPS